MSIFILAGGLCHCSVCAPADMDLTEVERLTNIELPTGIESNWQFDKDSTHFAKPRDANGQPTHTNPCVCETDSSRKHYLMVC